MKQFPKALSLVVCCAGLLMTGCNDHGNKKADDETVVLHRLPYAPLTDSLGRVTGDEAAGLYFRRADLLSRNKLHERAAADSQQAWDLKPDEATGIRYSSTLSIIGESDKAIRVLKD